MFPALVCTCCNPKSKITPLQLGHSVGILPINVLVGKVTLVWVKELGKRGSRGGIDM
eukprot:jgi/Botrbrau1/13627/Bobra.0373s0006.1